MHAVVGTDDATVRIDDRSRAQAAACALFDEARVRTGARADEAKLLALAFARSGELPRERFGAHFALRALAERKDEAIELFALRRI
jgi:hypothetical protein